MHSPILKRHRGHGHRMSTLRVAAVQAEPVLMDAKATLSKAVDLIRQAGDKGARLILFPETFVPAYAQWAHSARFEDALHKRAFARLARQSVRVPQDLEVVAAAARRAGATVAIGVTERVDGESPANLYNTLAVFGPYGEFLGKHRKLVPTHHERTVYRYGDGDTLRAFQSEGTRFGGLLCWNNFMPLARFALYQQGIQVWLAPTADDLPSWQTAMKYIARESRCFVLSAVLLQRKSHFPDDWELRGDPAWEAENEWNERGGSCIVGPDGEYLVEPVYEEETVLVADCDLDRVVAERLTFDPSGHYARPEVLDLQVRGLGLDAGR